VTRDLGGGPADVGLLRGVQAVGGLIGGALLGLLVDRVDARRLTAGSLAAFGLLSLATWNAPVVTTALGWYAGLFVAAGLPGLASLTGLTSILQAEAEPDGLGRVLSTFFAAYGGAQAAGMLAAGLVGTGIGLTLTLQVQGGLYLAAAALALRLTARTRAVQQVAGP
jgi:MFS family permease